MTRACDDGEDKDIGVRVANEARKGGEAHSFLRKFGKTRCSTIRHSRLSQLPPLLAQRCGFPAHFRTPAPLPPSFSSRLSASRVPLLLCFLPPRVRASEPSPHSRAPSSRPSPHSLEPACAGRATSRDGRLRRRAEATRSTAVVTETAHRRGASQARLAQGSAPERGKKKRKRKRGEETRRGGRGGRQEKTWTTNATRRTARREKRNERDKRRNDQGRNRTKKERKKREGKKASGRRSSDGPLTGERRDENAKKENRRKEERENGVEWEVMRARSSTGFVEKTTQPHGAAVAAGARKRQSLPTGGFAKEATGREAGESGGDAGRLPRRLGGRRPARRHEKRREAETKGEPGLGGKGYAWRKGMEGNQEMDERTAEGERRGARGETGWREESRARASEEVSGLERPRRLDRGNRWLPRTTQTKT